jgi:hypothetical protein
MKGRRGSVLVLVLLLTGLFLIMGAGFLSQRISQNKAARSGVGMLQARALAEAGIQEAVAKLSKHRDFPPKADFTHRHYSYSEEVLDRNGKSFGWYTVTIDTTLSGSPNWILRLSSTGYLGDRSRPTAKASLVGEIDLCPFQRPDTRVPPRRLSNLRTFEFFYLREGDDL